MNKIFKILALILLGLTITSCELLSPKFWAEIKREDDMTGREYDSYTGKTTNSRPHCLLDRNGRTKECRKTPYENKRFTGCSGSKYDIRGRICTYEDY